MGWVAVVMLTWLLFGIGSAVMSAHLSAAHFLNCYLDWFRGVSAGEFAESEYLNFAERAGRIPRQPGVDVLQAKRA